MCGIAGIIGLGRANPLAVAAMSSLLAHRGPDGAGLWSDEAGTTVFGHRRLAVIDISDAGRQPMSDRSGDFAITFNGEIYNYLELAAELKEEGAVFRTETDTEVILEAWRAWGEDCVGRFNGMFAFALHDRRTGTVFFARDRFGEKPFLYAAGDGFLAFASEYKALFALKGVEVRPDWRRIASFLAAPGRTTDFGPETAFEGIGQLCPGECMTVDCRDLSIRRRIYWAPGAENGAGDGRADGAATISFPDAVARFRELLADSVRLRLRSDVPLGSCLSGGLDSGSIYGLVRDIVGDDVPYHVFTGRFPGSAADEGVFVDEIARRGNAVRHDVAPDPGRLESEIARFVWHNELPVDSASQYGQWCVFRTAAEAGVTVLLDGQGADETLGGYEQYFAAYLAGRRADGGATAAEEGAEEAAIRARYPAALSMRDQSWKRSGPRPLRKAVARIAGRGSDFMFGVRAGYASDAAQDDEPGLRAALRRDSHGGFLTTLLRYGDRNSMAHSREVRLPFCDHRLLEFSLSLPPEYLMGDAQTKRLLREAMRGVLPEPVRTRWNKQGFLPPVADWLDGGLIDAVATRVDAPAFARNGPWDAGWWRAAVRRYRNGDRTLAASLWKVFAADAWAEHFVARAAAMERHAPLL